MARYMQITQHIRYAPSVLALRDIAPFGRNVVYAGNVSRNYLFWIIPVAAVIHT